MKCFGQVTDILTVIPQVPVVPLATFFCHHSLALTCKYSILDSFCSHPLVSFIYRLHCLFTHSSRVWFAAAVSIRFILLSHIMRVWTACYWSLKAGSNSVSVPLQPSGGCIHSQTHTLKVKTVFFLKKTKMWSSLFTSWGGVLEVTHLFLQKEAAAASGGW